METSRCCPQHTEQIESSRAGQALEGFLVPQMGHFKVAAGIVSLNLTPLSVAGTSACFAAVFLIGVTQRFLGQCCQPNRIVAGTRYQSPSEIAGLLGSTTVPADAEDADGLSKRLRDCFRHRADFCRRRCHAITNDVTQSQVPPSISPNTTMAHAGRYL